MLDNLHFLYEEFSKINEVEKNIIHFSQKRDTIMLKLPDISDEN